MNDSLFKARRGDDPLFRIVDQRLMKGEPRIPLCAGGSKSEGQWRREFAAGGTVGGVRVPGLPIHGPAQSDVEVGIDRVWGAFNNNKLLVFDDLHGLLDE